MTEQPPRPPQRPRPPHRLSLPPGYRPPRRHPSRWHVARRRVLALLILAALIALLYGVVRVALGQSGSSSESQRTTQTIVRPLRIVFPEGFNREQMAERIGEVNEIARTQRKIKPRLSPEKFLALTRSSTLPARFAGDKKRRSLEGFLFPATYEFLGKTTTRQLVDDQIAAFRKNWRKLNLHYSRSKNLTAYDVLIIASMVEKEAFSPDERAKIAGVIYNRLHEGMALGIDATLRYGLHLEPTQSLAPYVDSANPYNTRHRLGLPPTPIASPGLASMQAAAHPDRRHGYLYFLRRPGGRSHYFTASFADFRNKEEAWGYVG